MQKHARWYRPILGVFAAVEALAAVGSLIDRYRTDTQPLFEGVAAEVPANGGPLWEDLLFSGIMAACAIALAGAIYMWHRRPRQAGLLTLVGLAPALISGVVFFWFPPFWLTTAVAAFVFVQILRTLVTPQRVR